jgi:pyridoxal 5'-phosphate synthase pdxT subunit
MRVGVLALQGDFEAHAKMLARLGAEPVQVRTVPDLAGVDRLVIPGGESTTITKLATTYDLVEPLRKRAAEGMPVFGTCAGMIVCARRVLDGEEPILPVIDIAVRRNAYGRQIDSFEADVTFDGVSETVHAVFIRAPWVEETADGVEVLARHDGRVVAARQGRVLVCSFHPELTDDDLLHRMFLEL